MYVNISTCDSLCAYEEGKIYIHNKVRYIPTYHPPFARSRNTTYTYNLFNHTRLMSDRVSATAKTRCNSNVFDVILQLEFVGDLVCHYHHLNNFQHLEKDYQVDQTLYN